MRGYFQIAFRNGNEITNGLADAVNVVLEDRRNGDDGGPGAPCFLDESFYLLVVLLDFFRSIGDKVYLVLQDYYVVQFHYLDSYKVL